MRDVQTLLTEVQYALKQARGGTTAAPIGHCSRDYAQRCVDALERVEEALLGELADSADASDAFLAQPPSYRDQIARLTRAARKAIDLERTETPSSRLLDAAELLTASLDYLGHLPAGPDDAGEDRPSGPDNPLRVEYLSD